MPLADNALTTLEAVKEYLKIPVGTTVDDTKLEDLINSCSTAIENYCGRNLKSNLSTRNTMALEKVYFVRTIPCEIY
jgi:hypothetical protein